MTVIEASRQNVLTKGSAFPLDPEHGALRTAMLLSFVLIWIVAFVLGDALLSVDGATIIALVAGFVVAALGAQRLERWLKPRWPSGRIVSIEDGHIRLLRRDQEQESLDVAQSINVLTWCFRISRRARVPKGWYMVACALEQDERYIPVYAFLSPEEYERLRAQGQFTLLHGRKQRKQDGDLRLAGAQKRLHSAEQVRWLLGGEMNADDFSGYLRHLQQRFPDWMPTLV